MSQSSEHLSSGKAAQRLGGAVKHERWQSAQNSAQPLNAWLHSHRASALDALRRLWQQPIASLFTCLVMAVALSLPAGLALLLASVERLSGNWQQAAQISVYLKPGSSEAQGLRLRDSIAALPEVASVQWISPDEALAQFAAQSGLADVLDGLAENPLPASLHVTPKEIDAATLKALEKHLASLPAVDLVQLDWRWAERLGAILALGQHLVLGLSLLLALALLLVIGNTIRLHIENRRSEIEVSKLVGATDAYVRRPFLYMGALYGAGGGLLAALLLAYSLDWLNQSVTRLAALYASDFALSGVGLGTALLLALLAVALGCAGAWLAVWRHLRELAPK